MNFVKLPLVRQSLPGLLIALALWIITMVRWNAASFATQEMNALWQSAGIDHLRGDPWGTLGVLHIQPPGMNALFALDLAVSPGSHALILGLNLIVMLATIVMIVDVLQRWGCVPVVASGAGIAYALLPSTVIYSQWVYSVSIIAFLAMSAVWGVSVFKGRPALGAFISGSALGLAALIRPSFIVPLALVWILVMGVVLIRTRTARRWLGVAGLAVVAAGVLAVQAHYFVSFGLTTMSSWTGENLAKALQISQSLNVTPQARQEIASSPCQAQMLQAYEAGDLNRWDWEAFRGLPACAAVPGLAPRGVAAWDSPVKGSISEGNFVYSERLVASREWTQMMTTIVRNDPGQLVRMAITSDFGPRSSGVGLYLSPAEDYPFVQQIRDAHPLAVPLGLWSLLFAPVAFALVIFGVVFALVRRDEALRVSPVFWSAVTLTAYHLVVNVLFEYSENMRYRAEIDAVLLTAAALVIGSIVQKVKR